MPKTTTLTFKRTIKAKATDVFEALTSSAILRQWFCDTCLINASKGGRFYAEWNSGYYTVGNYSGLTPGKKIVFSWQGKGEPAESWVQIGLAEKKGQTMVTVAHSGLGTGTPWAKAVKQIATGWETALEALQLAMETGEDLRIISRPMLGISLDSFDATIAAKLGVPVDNGVRLNGTLEGMGAAAAGLRPDDVIVSLGGKKVTGTSLAGVLQNRRGGETVPVKFYRGKDLHSVQMLLSKRPLPEIPATPAALATAVQKVHDEVNAELDKVFAGVSEAAASARPAPTEWSAKEILCHLVVGEYGGHSFLAEQIDGHVRQYDSFGGNVNAQNSGLLSVYPTAQELLAEYKRARRETVAFLAAIPPEFVKNKSTWWTICFGNLQPPLHDQGHIAQMHAAIASHH